MNIKRLHYFSGVVLTIFIGLHLFNHCYGILGIDHHIEMMNFLRQFYRNIFVESILLLAVLTQIISGLKLFNAKRKSKFGSFEMLQIWSGLYLALFFILHVGAILTGRFLLKLDTNYYFGAAGLNYFPTSLIFIPYYSLAIMAFFGHIASIHHAKMNSNLLGMSPSRQSMLIFILGIIITMLIMASFTLGFKGVEVPDEYLILTGKFS